MPYKRQFLSFNGNSRAEFAGDADFSHEGNYTLETWLYVASPPVSPATILQSGGFDLRLENTSGLQLKGTFGASQAEISTELPISQDPWRHVALVVSYDETLDTSRAVLYVDGKQLTEQSTSGKTSGVGPNVLIGVSFLGALGELRIWKQACDQEELKAAMVHKLTGREENLLAYLPMDEANNDAVRDVVMKRSVSLQETGWTELDSPTLFNEDYVLRIQWAGEYASAADYTGFSRDQFTIEFWIRSWNTAPGACALAYHTSGEMNALLLKNLRNLSLTVDGQEIQSAINVADGEWHHVALSWHSLTGRVVIHKDFGATNFEGEIARGALLPESGNILLGRAPDAGSEAPPFRGDFSELRIWDGVRSSLEIYPQMFSRLDGTEPGLSSYWPLERSEGNSARDDSGNNRPLGLTGCERNPSDLFLRTAPIEQLKALRAERELLVQKIIELGGDPTEPPVENSAEISIDELIRNTNTQLNTAWQVIQENQDGIYQMADVSLEFKVLPDAVGQKIRFPEARELEKIDADHLSLLKLNFAPRIPEITPLARMMPDVGGYTESLARRRLLEVGLNAEVSYQSVSEVDGQPIQAGRVVNQLPAALDAAPASGRVMIFVGKAREEGG